MNEVRKHTSRHLGFQCHNLSLQVIALATQAGQADGVRTFQRGDGLRRQCKCETGLKIGSVQALIRARVLNLSVALALVLPQLRLSSPLRLQGRMSHQHCFEVLRVVFRAGSGGNDGGDVCVRACVRVWRCVCVCGGGRALQHRATLLPFASAGAELRPNYQGDGG